PLTGSGEEHLRRRGVRVLLEEVVLDLPREVVAQPIGELDLVERLLQQPILAALVPRPGELVLVEDPEPHGAEANGPDAGVGRLNSAILKLATLRPWRARATGTHPRSCVPARCRR